MISDSVFLNISKNSNDILDENENDIYQSLSKLHVIKHHSTYFSNIDGKKTNLFIKKNN